MKWFNNLKIGKKILYTSLFAIVIPLLIVQVLVLYVISNNVEEKVNELMMTQLEQTAERTSITLDVYTNLVYQIYTDNSMIDNVLQYSDANSKESARIYRDICDKLQQYGTFADGIECISVILPNGRDITYDFGIASAVDNIWKQHEDIRNIEPYTEAQKTENIHISVTEKCVSGNKEICVFHISKKMYDLKNIQNGTIATVVLSVNESVLNSVCNTDEYTINKEIFSANFIMDRSANVFSFPNSFYAGIQLSEGQTVEEFIQRTNILNGKEIAINQYVDDELEWVFYNAYDRDYLFKEVEMLRSYTLLLGVVLLGFSVLLIRYTTKLIEDSVEKVISGIKEVQAGNLDVTVSVQSGDEIKQIADNLNTMTSKVKELIREMTEATERQHKAEIRALEAQINPHFLYNTLDSINWMAIEKQEYEISKMLRNLGVILRYSISQSNQKVSVLEMTDWLEKYLSLQKMRFNDVFSWEIFIEEEAKELKIHKLLVQPFVENAVIHGFKGIEAGGMIRIDIMLSEEKDKLTIIIEDNGKGIPKEVLEEMKKWEYEKKDSKHIGLENTFTRMQMYYGETASGNISSIPEIGTIVTLNIPIDKEVEE